MTPSLTYVLTTRNKLPYLTCALEALIANKAQDEEILVSDGGSTDGTKEYLESLHAKSAIDFYISEPDTGEADGYNKIIRRARGDLIKLITDDDSFHYPGIKACKNFMLSHPEIQFLNTNGIKRRAPRSNYPVGPLMYDSAVETWLKQGTPFSSCGLGIMVRRSALDTIGLLDTTYVRTDAEYTLRATSKSNIAWYTQECYARILNTQSNTTTQADQYYYDTDRLNMIYLGKPMPNMLVRYGKRLKRKLHAFINNKPQDIDGASSFKEWSDLFGSSQTWLAENAAHAGGHFLYRK